MRTCLKTLDLVILILPLLMCAHTSKKEYVSAMDPAFCIQCHREVTPGLFHRSVGQRPPHPTEGRVMVLADPQLYVGTSHR